MNKVTLIAVSCILGLSLGTSVGIAQAAPTDVIQSHRVQHEVPSTEMVETPSSAAPALHAVSGGQHRTAKAKVWTCGQMKEIGTGGMARTCEWK